MGGWARAPAQGGFSIAGENSVRPCLEDNCFAFNYTKFPDFILSYQRCQHIATRRKPGWEPARKVPVGLGKCWASSESHRLSVHRPRSQLGQGWPGGCPQGGLCPSQVHGGSPWMAQQCPPLTPNRRLSVSVLALQRGGQCQGPRRDQCQPAPPGFPTGCCLGWWGAESTPLPRSAQLPQAAWGGEYAAAQPKL